MTSNIFDFLLRFASILGNMANDLWDFLNKTIQIDGVDIPVYALIGTGAVIGGILLSLLKAIIL